MSDRDRVLVSCLSIGPSGFDVGDQVSANDLNAVVVDVTLGLLLDTGLVLDSTAVDAATEQSAESALAYLGDLATESGSPAEIEMGLAVVTDPTPHDASTGRLLIQNRSVWIVRARGVISTPMGPPDHRPEDADEVVD